MTNEINPLFSKTEIRIDTMSQRASVIDVIKMVTTKDAKHASKCIERLPIELRQRFDNIYINGKGKDTLCANAATCVEVIWELPGKAAKEFRRQSAHYICRILGGDRTLIEEIETRFERTDETSQNFFVNSSTERPLLPTRTDVEQSRIRQRKLEDLEITERESRLLQSQLDMQQSQLTIQRSRVELQLYFKSILENDAEVVAATNDNIKQIIICSNISSSVNSSKMSSSSDNTERKSPFLPDLTQIVHEICGKVLPTHQLSKIGRAVECGLPIAARLRHSPQSRAILQRCKQEGERVQQRRQRSRLRRSCFVSEIKIYFNKN